MVVPRPFWDGVHRSPISFTDKGLLDSAFSLEEIRRVVFGFDGNKALGPDGFPMVFSKITGCISRRIFGESPMNFMRETS